jgi:hypothetical protein
MAEGKLSDRQFSFVSMTTSPHNHMASHNLTICHRLRYQNQYRMEDHKTNRKIQLACSTPISDYSGDDEPLRNCSAFFEE